LWFRPTTSNLSQALVAYQRVGEQAPEFAPAHAGTANAWIMLAAHDVVAPRPAYQAAMAASERALELSGDLPEALVGRAWAKLALDHDWAAATRMFERALELNSSYGFAYAGYGHLLLARGRVDEAVAAMERGYRLDPLSAAMAANLSTASYYARRYDEAIRMARRALELDEGNSTASSMLASSYLAQRRYPDAVDEFERAVKLAREEEPVMVAQLAYAYAVLGRTASAEPILGRLESGNGQVPKPAYYIALIRLVLGDVNGAVRWLERACQQRFHRTLFLGVDPRLDVLRGTKHFEDMCKQAREPDLRKTQPGRRRGPTA
jgi:tetratricopeptide (TPR) repeat protein